MDSRTSLPYETQALQEPSVPFRYYRYRLERPVACDLEFRKFMVGGIEFAHVLPLKSGPTLKETQRGVVQIPSYSTYPHLSYPFYQGVPIRFEQISENQYQKDKVESQTKIFFRGFPSGTTPQEVEMTFNSFGEISFVFMMKTKGQYATSIGQGYFFFRERSSVEKLLKYPGKLFYGRHRIHHEEFKSTIPGKRQIEKKKKSLLNKKLQVISIDEILPQPVQNQKGKASDSGQGTKFDTELDFRSLCGRKRPYLSICKSVALNLAQPENIRLNLVRPTYRPTRPVNTFPSHPSLLAENQRSANVSFNP